MLSNFRFQDFLSGTGLVIMLPVAVALFIFLKSTKRIDKKANGTENINNPLKLGALAFLWGIVCAAVWFTWSPTSGLDLRAFLRRGGLVDYAYWQGAGCAVMVILGDLFLIWKQQAKYSAAVLAALLIACGFATAFMFSSSFGVASQDGIGAALSLIGISIVLLAINMVLAVNRSLGGNETSHS